MEKCDDANEIGVHLVEESVAKHEDLPLPWIIALGDNTPTLAQSC